jgi:hypothetical protein
MGNTKVKASRRLNDHWDLIAPMLQRFVVVWHGLWRPKFGEVNTALHSFTACIERDKRDNVAQQAFLCMKHAFIASRKALTQNPYDTALIEGIDQRFSNTADGARLPTGVVRCATRCRGMRVVGDYEK